MRIDIHELSHSVASLYVTASISAGKIFDVVQVKGENVCMYFVTHESTEISRHSK